MPPFPDEEPLYRTQIDRRLLRRLLELARPHRGILIGSVALLLVVSAMELTFPILMKRGIDTYIDGKDTRGLFHLSLVYLGLLIAVFFLRYFQQVLTQSLGQRIMFDLRRRLFSHVQGLSVSYFERNPVGRIMTRLTGDVEVLNDLFTSGLVSIFGDVVILLGIMTVMIVFDWRLAVVCFLVLPPLIWATFVFRARVRESYTTIRLKVAAMNTFLQENITGISLVQLFRREDASRATFDGLNREHRDAFLRSVQAHSIYFPVVELLEALAAALILGYGGDRVLTKAISIGALVAFVQYSERFFRPIRDLSERYNTLQGAMASSERIFELLDTQANVKPPVSPHTPVDARGEIVFDHVRFGYKTDEPVLHDLSFRIAPGEAIAVVGHTGAGKTTIASLLVRFYDVWGGSIRVDGIDVREYPIDTLRRRIAIVPQDVFLFSGSALRNIGLRDAETDPERIRGAVAAVGATDFLERLPQGLETDLRERGNMLSVGQKQLLSFARALARDPRVLILDEATSSVDTQSEMKIREALRVLIRGRTSLVIAHRLSTIRHVDRILVLHKGKLVDQGTHDELLRREGIYAKLYQLEFKAQEEEGVATSPGSG